MPDPLTDELTDEAKAYLAVVFAEMKARYQPRKVWEIRVDRDGEPYRVRQW
ncbi:hypothetical protein [Mycobacterium kansasii]|uniref:hypothetical protein n=1 Tax=Mycobacterium kansasii TaxID=1768 RepID=UPI0015E43C0D|nr:hypothetical protein [Mycobacterium kansasii]